MVAFSIWEAIWLIFVTFVFVSVLMMLFSVIVDLFRDDSLSGWGKAGSTLPLRKRSRASASTASRTSRCRSRSRLPNAIGCSARASGSRDRSSCDPMRSSCASSFVMSSLEWWARCLSMRCV